MIFGRKREDPSEETTAETSPNQVPPNDPPAQQSNCGGIVNQAMIAETSFCAAGTNASIGSAIDCLETIHEGCSPSPISPLTMPNRLADQRNMSKVEPKLAQKPSDAIRNNKRNLLSQTKKWMSFSLGSPPTINEVSKNWQIPKI
jgi:hypothetical protein